MNNCIDIWKTQCLIYLLEDINPFSLEQLIVNKLHIMALKSQITEMIMYNGIKINYYDK